MLTLSFSLCPSFHVTVARYGHTSVVLSDGSVLVMGGAVGNYGTRKNDAWKTVNGGASWILVTSSAGWTGKKILHLSTRCLSSPPREKRLVDGICTVECVSCRFCRCEQSHLFCHDYLSFFVSHISDGGNDCSFSLMRLIIIFSPLILPPFSTSGWYESALDADSLLLPLSFFSCYCRSLWSY
jgi:hypothetical protein